MPNQYASSIASMLEAQSHTIGFTAAKYRNSKWAQDQITESLRLMNESLNKGGKIIVCGIGKSYKIASKAVATLNSLCVDAALLHPSEALHGDLGIVRDDKGDCIVLISASGRSPELVNMLHHVPESVPVMLLTCRKSSDLADHAQVKSLIYGEIPAGYSEESLYGIPAPTISTTLCMSLMDSICITVAEMHIKDFNTRKRLFGERHPGGSIGDTYASSLKRIPSSNSNASQNTEFSVSSDDSTISETSVSEASTSVEASCSVSRVEKLPDNEPEMLKLVLLHDYIIVSGSHIADCRNVRSIVRQAHAKNVDFDGYKWSISETLSKL